MNESYQLFPIHWHAQRCETCRFFRIHRTGAVVSECLLHGYTLGISTDASDLYQWARAVVCDLWRKRPKTWRIYSEGVEKNPHWHDPYLSRKRLQFIRKQFIARGVSRNTAVGTE